MKKTIILSAVIAMLSTACTTDKTRDFIPGTYVNHAEGEYSIANDTLMIEPVEQHNYIIYRKTGFRRINNGNPGQREHETEQWQAIYDESTKTLQETNQGKQLTFYPDKKQLKLGKRVYSKIK